MAIDAYEILEPFDSWLHPFTCGVCHEHINKNEKQVLVVVAHRGWRLCIRCGKDLLPKEE
jgi:hypothetical protein